MPRESSTVPVRPAERGWSGSAPAPPPDPVLTVVCPCLNSTATLAVQLDALSAQQCGFPWELIVVDDGSTDGTPELARTYTGRVPCLRVLEADRPRTQAEGINAGAAAARGRYLLVVDSDDEVAPGYLAAMKAELDFHPVVGARLDDRALNPEWARVRMEPMQQQGLSVLHGFLPVVVGAALGIHLDVFDKLRGFDPSSTPLIDVDLSWRLQLQGYDLAFAAAAVLRYRYRTGWRATYRQKRNYAVGDVLLLKRYRDHGAPRRRLAETLRGWSYVIGSGIRVHDRRSALLFADHLGTAVGRFKGSLRHRYLNL